MATIWKDFPLLKEYKKVLKTSYEKEEVFSTLAPIRISTALKFLPDQEACTTPILSRDTANRLLSLRAPIMQVIRSISSAEMRTG